MSITINEADGIRREMAMIRLDMHKDVRGVVATAEKVADWSRYLGKYPWVSLGVAFGIGFWMVPKKKPKTLMELPSDLAMSRLAELTNRPVGKVVETASEKTREAKSGLVGAAFGMLAPLAVRAAQGYALKYLEQWIAQQQFLQPSSPSSTASSRPPSAPGSGSPYRT